MWCVSSYEEMGYAKVSVEAQDHLSLFILFIFSCFGDMKQIHLWTQFKALQSEFIKLGNNQRNAKMNEMIK